MHIEPGLVGDEKIWLSYVTAAGVAVTVQSARSLRKRGQEDRRRRPLVLQCHSTPRCSLPLRRLAY